ncbi:hypothetical protein CXQ85_005164 [Candidozyma haemuli]|uniref:VPS37 C-terminal domain-containing protein n=1 Tax=Candidozyma haemuli TaxID=45357 RepID=A0A2V1AXP3_9ASCO|nr:hypothetical protein CXQ85_005164 [[Candida] haemuloni]PVH22592.1 hypothetical protein CXQ85_005164 [[Candida] haemuloni]
MAAMKNSIIPITDIPQEIKSLPEEYQSRIISSQNLLKGYVTSFSEYQEVEKVVACDLEGLISTLNDIIGMISSYKIVFQDIKRRLLLMNDLYKEFISLETYQYQLLSSSFHQSYLRLKFKESLDELQASTMSTCRQGASIPTNKVNSFLDEFTTSRRKYHLKQEKYNRWTEERVSGFV